jgi:hypothetical protein
MTTRSWIRDRFARSRRTLRKTPAWCRQSLEALEDRTLLSVNFAPAVNFDAGGHVSSVAVGDFNDDGKPDLAVANFNDATLSVLLNTSNSAPTSIALSASNVPENQPSGTAVGTFTTTDPDRNDTFTYTLVGGTGSADNGAFTIVGNQLKTAASFDFETKSSYSIRVRSTDQGGLATEKVFTISISNVNELPTVTGNQPVLTVNEGSQSTNRGTFTDPEGRDTVTLTASVGKVTQSNTNGNWTWTYRPPDGPASATVTITATDAGGLTATTSFDRAQWSVRPGHANDSHLELG